MVDCFNRLWHDSVVGCDNQDRDVSDLSTAGTHSGECFVTGGIDERDRTLATFMFNVNLVGADVLRNATVLGVDHVGVTDRVKQLGLAVVDVAHDGDDRRTRHEVFDVVEFFGLEVDIEGLQ